MEKFGEASQRDVYKIIKDSKHKEYIKEEDEDEDDQDATNVSAAAASTASNQGEEKKMGLDELNELTEQFKNIKL